MKKTDRQTNGFHNSTPLMKCFAGYNKQMTSLITMLAKLT